MESPLETIAQTRNRQIVVKFGIPINKDNARVCELFKALGEWSSSPDILFVLV